MSYLLRLFTFKITTVCGKYLHFTAGKKKKDKTLKLDRSTNRLVSPNKKTPLHCFCCN